MAVWSLVWVSSRTEGGGKINPRIERSHQGRKLLGNGVDDGVSGVGLDGGQNSLTGGGCEGGSGSCDDGSSWGSHGETSIRKSSGKRKSSSVRKSSGKRKSSSEGSGDGGGGVDVGDDVSGGSSVHTSTEEAGIGVREDGDGSSLLLFGLTPLPLLGGGGSSSLSSSVSLGEVGLGSGDLSGVLNSDGEGKVENRGSKRSSCGGSSRNTRGDGKVGGGHPESVDRVGDVVGGLEKSVGINVLVGSGGHSVSVTGLSASRWTTSVSERELSELILSVELGGLSWEWPWCKDLPGGDTCSSCQYNQTVHCVFP